MSWWCDKCQMLNYSKDKCVGCGHVQEHKSLKSYTAPNRNNNIRIINFEKLRHQDKETITLNKKTITMIALVIIALSMAFLAKSVYQVNKENEAALKYVIGTDDIDEYLNANKEKREELRNNSKMKEDMEVMMDFKLPNIDIGKNQREMNEREAHRKRIEERNRQINIQNYERAKAVDKANVLMQMKN